MKRRGFFGALSGLIAAPVAAAVAAELPKAEPTPKPVIVTKRAIPDFDDDLAVTCPSYASPRHWDEKEACHHCGETYDPHDFDNDEDFVCPSCGEDLDD